MRMLPQGSITEKGGETMFVKNEVQGALLSKGITLSKMAKMLHMTNATLSKRLHGDSEWKLSEVRAIREIIGTEEMLKIFFGNDAS